MPAGRVWRAGAQGTGESSAPSSPLRTPRRCPDLRAQARPSLSACALSPASAPPCPAARRPRRTRLPRPQRGCGRPRGARLPRTPRPPRTGWQPRRARAARETGRGGEWPRWRGAFPVGNLSGVPRSPQGWGCSRKLRSLRLVPGPRSEDGVGGAGGVQSDAENAAGEKPGAGGSRGFFLKGLPCAGPRCQRPAHRGRGAEDAAR